MLCVSSVFCGFSSSGSNITPWHSSLGRSLSTSNGSWTLSANCLLRLSLSIASLRSLSSVIPHHVLSPCPSPFWTNHRQRCHVLTPPHWKRPAWQQPCIDALGLSGYVCPCQGPQRRLHNVGGRGRDTNQAELSWDSMSTAGPFQRQWGSNRLGGMGSITFSV